MSKFSMGKWDGFGPLMRAVTDDGTKLRIQCRSTDVYWVAYSNARRVREVNGEASSVDQAKRLCAAAASYIEASPKVRGR